MRPDDGDACSHCHHPFGGHYITHDGRRAGCSARNSNRSNAAICQCRGFMILWRPEMEQLRLVAGTAVQDAHGG